MRGLRTVYEQAHGVLIDDEALQAAAVLSDRYISGRQLPDKAIDVLDTAAARVAINLTSAPRQVSALKTNSTIRDGNRDAGAGATLSLSRPDERLSVLQQQRIEIEQQTHCPEYRLGKATTFGPADYRTESGPVGTRRERHR